jgi:hypothetical protein
MEIRHTPRCASRRGGRGCGRRACRGGSARGAGCGLARAPAPSA